MKLRFSVNFYLTEYCNFECKHCIHDCGPRNKHTHMTLEQIVYAMSILEKLIEKKYEIGVIGISGGEPMTHPSFYNLVNNLCQMKMTHDINIPIELHTNGSIKFKPVQRFEKCFSKVFIGHDDFHREFRSLNELYLDELTKVSYEVVMRRNTWNGGKTYLRIKGRAKNLTKYEITGKKSNCIYGYNKHSNGGISIAFGKDHIRFCGENSHNTSHRENFTDYDVMYLEDVDKLVKKAVNYHTFYCEENCKVQCNVAFFKKIEGR